VPSSDSLEPATQSYEQFLEDIKGRIRSAQARAARAISAELIEVYWQIGREILQRQAEEGDRRGRGGPKVIERLSADLRAAFPGARGFSVSSLRYMRAFAAAWPEREMLQSGTGALPWAHIMLLLDKLSDRTTRDWYAARATSWSKVELAHHIASRLHEREGAAITNFGQALEDIERFMLALGEGFYFAGRQKSLEIGGEEFILDLLFFHHPTRRFVVIDLKIGPAP
jgi:predicted nuclease of restriction endonuclease-like (RecB) superfamily